MYVPDVKHLCSEVKTNLNLEPAGLHLTKKLRETLLMMLTIKLDILELRNIVPLVADI